MAYVPLLTFFFSLRASKDFRPSFLPEGFCPSSNSLRASVPLLTFFFSTLAPESFNCIVNFLESVSLKSCGLFYCLLFFRRALRGIASPLSTRSLSATSSRNPPG